MATCLRTENFKVDFSQAIGEVAKAAGDMDVGCERNYDVAEDLAQGLTDGLDMRQFSWRDGASHLVYLLTDAPSHGSQYWEGSALGSETRSLLKD